MDSEDGLKRITELELFVRGISEDNKLLSYQMGKLDLNMSDLAKTLNEVRDALLRLEAVESTRNYPGQLANLKEDISNLDDRIRLLENTNNSEAGQKSLVGWVIRNWPAILALACAVFTVAKHTVLYTPIVTH